MLSEKARELKREYAKEWNRKNPNKQKEYQAKYWKKKAEEEGTDVATAKRKKLEEYWNRRAAALEAACMPQNPED